MSTYKLYYFNLRARAEPARLIFAAVGQQYDDVRIEREQWPARKSEMPLGQMPVLEVNGVKLPQSMTIARFLARQFQLAGKDNFEQAQADAVVDTLGDISSSMSQIFREQDENKKKELTEKFSSEGLPKNLTNLETLGKLYGGGGPFFVGNHLKWADLVFYATLENILAKDGSVLDKFPWLKKNRAEVEKQPRIGEYLKNRPQTAM